MAEGKNKILVYKDWKTVFDKLTNEEAGALIKHFFDYVNDLDPKAPDRLTEIAFEPIKQTLKRDLEKWGIKAGKNRENGAKGGRPPKTEKNPKNPDGFLETQVNPEKPVTVNDSVSVTVNDINIPPKPPKGELTEKEQKFLNWFNSMVEKSAGSKGKFRTMTRTDKTNLKNLRSSYDDPNDWEIAFKQMTLSKWVIENKKCTVDHFLRPDNFMKYLNEGSQNEQPKKFKAPWQ